jgi:hypothetical protein
MAAAATVDAILDAAVAAICATVPGSRDSTVNAQAFWVGRRLHLGLSRGQAERELVAAAVSIGLTDKAARYKVTRGLDQGSRKPVEDRPVGGGGGVRPTRRSTPPIATPAPQPAPQPAPADPVHASEARDVWAQSVRPGGGGEAARELWWWLELRHLDPFVVTERDLIRALPAETLPAWCAHWRGRAVLPVYDHTGQIVTLRGRLVVPGAKGPKTIGPEGVPTGGRVYACPVAQRMLAGESVPFVVVTEGDPDFLSLASWWPLEERVAVIGAWSGALSAEVLARIPAGVPVLLCPHDDKTGTEMMRKAARPLKQAGCRVYVAPFRPEGDLNESLKIGKLEERLMAHGEVMR